MSMRRAHYKTKLGCRTCKRRRIKCDQSRPDCNNCTRRGLECSFRTFDPCPPSSARTSGIETEGGQSSTIRKYSPVSNDLTCRLPPPTLLDYLAGNNLLDGYPDILLPRLQLLLHNFLTETSATISHNAAAQATWCAAIPRLASSHQFILRGVFAVSSLHLSHKVGAKEEQQRYQTIAAAQMNTGLVHYRSALEHVSVNNAEALFAYSVTITSFVLLTTSDECKILLASLPKAGCQRHATIQDLTHAIIKIMRSLRGVLVILVPYWHHIANSFLGPITKRDWWPHPVPSCAQAIEEDRKLADIEKIWMRPDRPYEYWFDTLILALKRLREDFALISQLTINTDTTDPGNGKLIDWSAIMTWPTTNSLGFIDLLEQRCSEAWIILAHYAILPARAGKVWWIENLGISILCTAALILGEEMWGWIQWPASVVGVDLDSLRPRDQAVDAILDLTAAKAT